MSGFANLTYIATGVTQVFYIDIPFASDLQYKTLVNVSYTYEPLNGVITYTVNGTTLSNFYIPSNLEITKNLQPVKHNLSIITASANTVSHTSAFHNVTIEAVSSATLASEEVKPFDQGSDIYPNPSSDYINISTKSALKHVDIIDLSGRKVIEGTEKKV